VWILHRELTSALKHQLFLMLLNMQNQHIILAQISNGTVLTLYQILKL